jgi:hypothetical protein
MIASLAFFCMPSCAGDTIHNDPWYRPPPVEYTEWNWNDVASDEVWQVLDSEGPAAIRLLEEHPAIEMDQARGKLFAGIPPEKMNQGKFYLVRGLAFKAAHGDFLVKTGKYIVKTKNGFLWIRFGCMSHRALQTIRTPLIVRLPKQPEEVFVDTRMID